MKKADKRGRESDMLEEYDFSKGVRGKYTKRYAQGTNVVVVDHDLSKHFPDAKSVNDALRLVLRIRSDVQKVTR